MFKIIQFMTKITNKKIKTEIIIEAGDLRLIKMYFESL